MAPVRAWWSVGIEVWQDQAVRRWPDISMMTVSITDSNVATRSAKWQPYFTGTPKSNKKGAVAAVRWAGMLGKLSLPIYP